MMESVTKQQEQEKVIVDELAGLVQIHSDGSIRRTGKEPTLGMSQLEASQMGVKTRDMLVVMPWQQEQGQGQGQELLERGRGGHGHGHRVWVRLYVPEDEDADADAERELLPVVLYFHGGGFCMLSPASVIPHNMCVRWCSALRVLIVSVSYRLAPEHRLPAAYHDGAVAATWLLSGAGGDPWMRSHADLRNVFLLGDTAGCNIAHHVMLLLHRHGHAQGQAQAQAQAVRGVIMLQPFLGSQARTPSEIQDEEEQQQQRRSSSKSKSKSKRKRRVYDVRVSDTLWRMALPLGSDRDHPYCFPTAHGGDGALALPLPLPLPRTLVVMGGTEVGSERQVEYCDALRRRGVYVEALLLASEDHAFCSLLPHSAASSLVLQRVRRFIASASASASASPPSPFPVPRL